MSWLLMAWRPKESGHPQSWHLPSSAGISHPRHKKGWYNVGVCPFILQFYQYKLLWHIVKCDFTGPYIYMMNNKVTSISLRTYFISTELWIHCQMIQSCILVVNTHHIQSEPDKIRSQLEFGYRHATNLVWHTWLWLVNTSGPFY